MRALLLLGLALGLLARPALADVLIENANGYTLDGKGQLVRFRAMLVDDEGKVARLFAGDPPPAEVPTRRRAKEKPESADSRPRAAFALDARGRTLLPGMIDTHGHIMALGMRAMTLDLAGARSLAEAQTMIAAYARAHPQLKWITGGGWDETRWAAGHLPTAGELDAAVADRPVWIERSDGHGGWANTRALAEAGITARTKDPGGGRIERGAGGAPAGTLIETAADLVRHAVPYNPYLAEAALAKALAQLAAAGVTGVHDFGVDGVTWNLYRRFGDEGHLSLRIYAVAGGVDAMAAIAPVKPTPWLYGDRLRLAAVDFAVDGASATGGAWRKGGGGLPRLNDTQLKNSAVRAAMNGFQIAVTANGDAAIAELVDAYDELSQTYGKDRRWRVEGAQMATAADAARFAGLGVAGSVQPANQALTSSQMHIGLGSDFPAMAPAPLAGLGVAMAGGMPLERALAAATVGPAYLAFAEDRFGTLQPGRWADFILLDRDVVATPAALGQAQVVETWVGGKRVFQRKELR